MWGVGFGALEVRPRNLAPRAYGEGLRAQGLPSGPGLQTTFFFNFGVQCT